MTAALARTCQRFFFRPIPTTSIGLFRIALAAILLLNFASLIPEAPTWFGEQGILPAAYASRAFGGVRVNLFALLPASDETARTVLACGVAAAACLLVGFQTRLAAVAAWLALTSLQHRNPYICHSGDTLMRNFAFFLMFAPAGRSFSIDRWLRRLRGREDARTPLAAPWAQRLLQIQLAVMYVGTASWKLTGTTWRDGTAVFYALHLDEFTRFAVPAWMLTVGFSMFATWSTLAVELAMGTLVWFRRLRLPVMVCGAALHLGLEFTLDVPLFQWVVLAAYLLFLDAPVAEDAPPLGTAFIERTSRWTRRPTRSAGSSRPETPAPPCSTGPALS
jgi:hypothetical protein